MQDWCSNPLVKQSDTGLGTVPTCASRANSDQADSPGRSTCLQSAGLEEVNRSETRRFGNLGSTREQGFVAILLKAFNMVSRGKYVM
jgi:hypothetical protein